jgi:hypothetical protein
MEPDPVSAALRAFDGVRLSPMNYGYKASRWLLVGHLKYLDLHNDPQCLGKEPADCLVDWLLRDRFEPPVMQKVDPKSKRIATVLDERARWYPGDGTTAVRRVLLAYLQWALVAALLTFLGVWILRWILHGVGWSFDFDGDMSSWLLGFLNVSSACENGCGGATSTVLSLQPSWTDAIGLAVCGAVCTTLLGLIGRRFRNENDDPRKW